MAELLDPFTETYRKLREGLLAYEPFRALARGNFPDTTEKSFELFPSTPAQPGDTPYIMMVQGQFAIMPWGNNSKVSSVRQAYLMVTRHEPGLKSVSVNQLKFYTLIAMLKLGPDLGLPYVRDVNLTNCTDDALSANGLKLGTARYLTSVQINVDMDLDRRILAALEITP